MEKIPYSVTVEITENKAIIEFSGHLIINHISDIAKLITDADIKGKDVDIKINDPDNLDVTFVQLIYSIKHTISSEGKKVSISSELNDDLKMLLTNSGINL